MFGRTICELTKYSDKFLSTVDGRRSLHSPAGFITQCPIVSSYISHMDSVTPSSTPPNHAQSDPTALYDLVMHIIPYGPHLNPTSFSPPTPPSQSLQPHCVHYDVFPHLHDNDNILVDRAAYGVTVGGASKGLRIWVVLMGGAMYIQYDFTLRRTLDCLEKKY
ncbi:hypothetical protein EDB19DRAFT_1832195 [Suillus lakei]|nr:hypothetical protein EDB19DRAFT_1832195 [Suillus lakei]